MTVAGLIFSDIYEGSVPELTSRRTVASVPFGGRYRLIDFTLSNMVNSGISRIGIITHNNYHSLLGHIGNGKDWDMSRRSGGIRILPPLVRAYESEATELLPTDRLDAIRSVMGFITSSKEDHILLCDCDTVCNMDLGKLFDAHLTSGAGVTVVSCRDHLKEDAGNTRRYFIERDESGFVSDIYAMGRGSFSGELLCDMMVFNKSYLISMLERVISHGGRDFYRDLLAVSVKRGEAFSYSFEGTLMKISSLEDYFYHSMRLLDKQIRDELFSDPQRPILTKVRNSPPTRYEVGSFVKNSYIADGCVIEGYVENSILFRGVHVGRGAVIKNCVLMQDTRILESAELGYAVSDKNVTVKEGRRLFGYKIVPLFMPKGVCV